LFICSLSLRPRCPLSIAVLFLMLFVFLVYDWMIAQVLRAPRFSLIHLCKYMPDLHNHLLVVAGREPLLEDLPQSHRSRLLP
jgi:hypothetical protein